jgi:integral membrane sensor domain MASE1
MHVNIPQGTRSGSAAPVCRVDFIHVLSIAFGLALGMVMVAQLGDWYARVCSGGCWLIDPSAGFAVAALLVYGLGLSLPGIFCGAAGSAMLSGADPASAVMVGGGVVLHGLLGWWLVARVLKADITFPSLKDFFLFVAGACLAGPAVTAFWELLSPPPSAHAQEVLVRLMGTWQAGALGTLLFGVFFLLAFRRQDFRPHEADAAAELLGYSAMLGGLVYLLMAPGPMAPSHFMALSSACALLAMLVAIRFGLRSSALFLVIFVLLVPAYSAMFPDQARGASAVARVPDQFGAPGIVALLACFGCFALAAYRDELVALRAKFSLAMASADLCMWDWSPAGWVCHTPAWREKFALPSGRVLSDADWKRPIHPEDLPGFERVVDLLVSHREQSWSHTYRMSDASGRWRWVRSHSCALRTTADNEIAAIAGVTRDITDERQAVQNEITAIETEAELHTLRSQLNPHFLFNALNSVRALIGRDDERARIMVSALGKFLRTLLAIRDDKVQSVAQEIGLVKNYLQIEGIRFGERIRESMHCDEALLPRRLPGLLLLTLVENAVKHGISKLDQGGTIEVSIVEDPADASMVVSVANDGVLGRSPEGCGLENTRRRIALATDGKGSLELSQHPGPKVVAVARFPDDHRRISTPAPPPVIAQTPTAPATNPNT